MKRLIPCLMVVLAFSLWFFLGFPFALRMESYAWLTELNRAGFVQVLTKNSNPVPTYRPLGQAVVWLGYRLSAGSKYLDELLNYLLAIVSWLVLFLAVGEEPVFSLVSVVVGGVFLSGYIYLFHRHGTFYSPLLLLIVASFLFLRGALAKRGTIALLVLAAILAFMRCEGLDVVSAEHLLITDNPWQFAAKLVRLLIDKGLYQYLTTNAWQLVVTRYDWHVIARQLLHVYAELAQ